MHKYLLSIAAIIGISVILTACLNGNTATSNNRTIPNITLQPIDSSKLPALQAPILSQFNGNWLIMGGLSGGFHGFSYTYTNPNIGVYNPNTQTYYSESMSNTDLPEIVQQQLRSTDQVYWRNNDTLYVIGGFYNSPFESNTYTTLDIITTFDISGMVTAIMNNESNLARFVHYNTSIPEFKVTGGGLGKIDDSFYLAFGQDCEGNYCGTAQIYTNTVYKISMDSTLSSIIIESSVSNYDLESSGFRRRDYNLAPFQIGDKQTLLAMGGPFTPGQEADVWTNGIMFDFNLNYNQDFINQQANQYQDANMTFYDSSNKITYTASFSGLSNLYWAESGLIYDNTTPYGNILDLISSDALGHVHEYANLQPMCSGQPLASCLYMGLDAQFVSANNAYLNDRQVLQLDKLPKNGSPVLVGYVYGGLVSLDQTVFGNTSSYATNQAYAIYLDMEAEGDHWLDITNLYPGN